MARLSVVLIVKNEAGVLAACLQRLTWADEIVVLDSGSTDATLEIARRYTDQVFVEADWQGYGIQRRRAQVRATGDWIFMVDADEHVTPALAHSIQSAVRQDDRRKAYAVARLPWCFGRFLRHGGWYPAYRVRLYPRDQGQFDTRLVHENLELAPGVTVERLPGDMLHYTYRDLQHYLTKSAHFAAEWAEQRQRQGKTASLTQGLLHALGCFVRMYLLKAGFLDGRQGLLMALLSSHSTFAKYADLWTRRQPASAAE